MPNHGYCKNCWWWQHLPPCGPEDIEEIGKCWMQSTDNFSRYTRPSDYCPDYANRKKEDKGMTLEEYLKKIL